MFKKLTYLITGAALLAAMFVAPAQQASALATAKVTMSGATQTNGNFSFTVYVDTGSDAVTTAYMDVGFSSDVNGVSYDYSVGPFTETLPNGAHSVKGEVSGLNKIALVRFTMSNPGTTTASISANTYLKHANRDSNGYAVSTETFAITRGSAVFTYNAPAQPQNNTGGNTSSASTTTPSSTSAGRSTSTSGGTGSSASNSSNSAVAGDSTTVAAEENLNSAKDDSNKKSDPKKTGNTEKPKSSKKWLWLVILAGAFAVYGAALYFMRGNKSKKSKAEKIVTPNPSATEKAQSDDSEDDK